MRLADYLDKGASLGADAPCLTTDGVTRTYAQTQDLSWRIAAALVACGAGAGASVAILSANDPVAFTDGVRHQPGGRRLVPGQPAQRGEREPRAARAVRLPRARLPGCVRAARRRHPRRPAEGRHLGVPRRPGRRGRAGVGGVPRARRRDRRPRAPTPGRRPGHDRRHGRHHRASQGGDAHPAEPRDDDGAHADELSVRGAADVPRAGAADPRGGRAVLPGPRARRARRRHARAGRRGVPGTDRAARGDAHLPAADVDLHGARPPRARRHGPAARCSASGTAPRRCRPRGSSRRCSGSAPWRSCSARPRRR